MTSVSSPQTSPREPALASILVRTERQVDWSRRRSSMPSMSSESSTDSNIDGKHAAATRRRSVSFAPKTRLRQIPSLLEMTREEIASIWQTSTDRSQSISDIAETIRIVRGLKDFCNEADISSSIQEDQYCERGIEGHIDERHKQRSIQQRRLVVAAVLSKQESLRQQFFDPAETCNREKELANVSATISRESAKKARVVAKKDLMAARGIHLSTKTTTTTTSSSSAPSSRHDALLTLKRDNSHRRRERQLFVGQVRQMLPRRYQNNDTDSSATSSQKSSRDLSQRRGASRRCRIAKTA